MKQSAISGFFNGQSDGFGDKNLITIYTNIEYFIVA